MPLTVRLEANRTLGHSWKNLSFGLLGKLAKLVVDCVVWTLNIFASYRNVQFWFQGMKTSHWISLLRLSVIKGNSDQLRMPSDLLCHITVCRSPRYFSCMTHPLDTFFKDNNENFNHVDRINWKAWFTRCIPYSKRDNARLLKTWSKYVSKSHI